MTADDGNAPQPGFWDPLSSTPNGRDQSKRKGNADEDKWEPIAPVPEGASVELPHNSKGTPSKVWSYRDAEGRLLMRVARFDPPGRKKQTPTATCCRHRDDGSLMWRWKALPTPRPLYGLDRLAAFPAAPVLIVEGEKTADAATALFPDHVAITWPNGTSAVSAADWAALKGRTVTIWPDADQPGQAAANEVARQAKRAGASLVRRVTLPSDLPDKWDVADPLPDGRDASWLRRLLDEAPPIEEPPAAAKTESPSDDGSWYQHRPDGLWFNPPLSTRADRGGNALEPMWLADSFKIAAKTWNEEAREHGLLLEWTDPRACPCEYILPRGEIDAPNPPWRKALGNLGLALAPGRRAANLLAAYLTRAQHETSVDLVRRTGWYGPDPDFSAFVLPDATIGPPLAEAVRFDGGALPGPKLARKGTLDGWKEGVARPAIGNSRLGLAILVALAAPLLRIVGQESAGLHLRGGSSVGKTTALRVAASVWGAELFNWRTTDNGLEATATSHNDLLLALDEIGQAEPKVMAAVAYMLANGRGKSRMSTDRVAIQPTTWRLLFLSTGETSLGETIKPGGGQVMAGQEVRFLDLPADAGQNLGLFDRLPEGCPSAAAFAEQIRTATESEIGSAGRAFVQWLMEQGNLTSLKTRLQREIEAWCARHIPRNADGQAIRAGRRFALLFAAGKLATEAGILPWPDDEAEFATVRCWGDWIANRGGFGSGEVRIVLERLQKLYRRPRRQSVSETG